VRICLAQREADARAGAGDDDNLCRGYSHVNSTLFC
jgi:hypothetical protein